MKLYFSPGSLGLAPQIALREAGRDFELVKVDFRTKTTVEGDYFRVTPKGFVPALKLDDGEVITEAPVVLQWIADHSPEHKLMPARNSPEHYRALEWLNYVATDIYKGYHTLFSPFLDVGSKARYIEGYLGPGSHIWTSTSPKMTTCWNRASRSPTPSFQHPELVAPREGRSLGLYLDPTVHRANVAATQCSGVSEGRRNFPQMRETGEALVLADAR